MFKDTFIEVDFAKQKITYAPFDDSFGEGDYPTQERQSKGFIIHRHTTTNFSSKENFVCLLAVDRLLSKGYEARHIILEPTFKVGHKQQVYGDILVLDKTFKPLCLIENKTYGAEFEKEWKNMCENGGQLFSYYAVNKTPYLCLLAYDFDFTSNKIIYKSHIITTLDNDKHLDLLNADITDKEKQRLAFKDPRNANAKDYFKVWNESYSLSYTTKGLLENGIAPYSVGKEKYTKDDLEVVPYSEIASIYHTFATILRNNAIGNYENTFYALVDLFLCKIIDEKENPKDLQFYYKGVAYDSPFDYIDRLLSLYEKGIDTLFKKKVVNVSKSEIDKLFIQAKRHKGKFKDKIQSIFDRQKYFNIKKFNFIEVENEEEFFINFKILIQITNLIQDFYITQSENNQFLGDLFEGFLNRSVHQTEGRFFTPTPITNFIIYSLPHLSGKPKVLDFACGAGHFLTEFIAHNENAKLYGIEKNKDLSKVAKTACILHNANEANIVFQDALDNIKERYAQDFEKASFDLILSNPPYSVKGFLSTLSKNVIDSFTLNEAVDSKSYETNGAIECFFIERAKHFLKENGLLVLVLPVSILQKAQIYEKTRELLFKHFKILALVEMNSRTFGSTGTQTIILFARRMDKYASDLIDALKATNFNDESIKDDFKENHFIKAYCEFMGYDESDFKTFMSGLEPTQKLKESEIFKEYFSDFNASKAKVFKKEKAKSLKENSEKFFSDIRSLEFEKMLYYALTKDEQILIIKSPNDKNAQNKSNKANIVKFLGYDWSKRKGDEGIKYQTTLEENGTTLKENELKESKDDSDEEKKSKEALRNINSIKRIKTPLYNPSDIDDSNKLNTALRDFIALQDLNNKQKESAEFSKLLEKLQPQEEDYYSIFINNLVDMLDFSRAEFNKAINLNSSPSSLRASNASVAIHNNPFENSKFKLVKVKDICEIGRGRVISHKYIEANKGEFPVYSSQTTNKGIMGYIKTFDFEGEYITWTTDGIYAGTCFYRNGKFNCTNVCGTLKIKNTETMQYKFMVQVLNLATPNYVVKSANPKLMNNVMAEVKIPKPPLEIQKQIVAECEEVERQYQTIRMSIDEYKKLIKAILIKCGVCESQKESDTHHNIDSILTQIITLNSQDTNELSTLLQTLPTPPKQGWERVKLGDLGEIRMCKRIMKHETNSSGGVPFYKIGTFGGKANAYIPQELYEDYKVRFSYPKTGQILISAAGTLGKAVVYDGEPAYFQDSNIVWLDADENKVFNKFLFIVYKTINWRDKIGTKGGIIERIYNENLRQMQIPLPPLKEQEKIISCIESIETQISHLNSTLPNLPTKNKEIIEKYLF